MQDTIIDTFLRLERGHFYVFDERGIYYWKEEVKLWCYAKARGALSPRGLTRHIQTILDKKAEEKRLPPSLQVWWSEKTKEDSVKKLVLTRSSKKLLKRTDIRSPPSLLERFVAENGHKVPFQGGKVLNLKNLNVSNRSPKDWFGYEMNVDFLPIPVPLSSSEKCRVWHETDEIHKTYLEKVDAFFHEFLATKEADGHLYYPSVPFEMFKRDLGLVMLGSSYPKSNVCIYGCKDTGILLEEVLGRLWMDFSGSIPFFDRPCKITLTHDWIFGTESKRKDPRISYWFFTDTYDNIHPEEWTSIYHLNETSLSSRDVREYITHHQNEIFSWICYQAHLYLQETFWKTARLILCAHLRTDNPFASLHKEMVYEICKQLANI
jgi:hypothetical protein